MNHPTISQSVRAFMSLSKRLRCMYLLWVPVLLVSQPEKANACDPNCDGFLFLTFGTPAALGTTLIAPLMGLALDRKPHSPYWPAVGFTALAAGVGWGIGAAATLPTGEQVDNNGLLALAALPVAMGSVATFLVYRHWSRRTDKNSSTLWHHGPRISVAPVVRGGLIKLNWHF